MGIVSNSKSNRYVKTSQYIAGEDLSKGDIVKLINNKVYRISPGDIKVGSSMQESSHAWTYGNKSACQINPDGIVQFSRGTDADLYASVTYDVEDIDISTTDPPHYILDETWTYSVERVRTAKAFAYNQAICFFYTYSDEDMHFERIFNSDVDNTLVPVNFTWAGSYAPFNVNFTIVKATDTVAYGLGFYRSTAYSYIISCSQINFNYSKLTSATGSFTDPASVQSIVAPTSVVNGLKVDWLVNDEYLMSYVDTANYSFNAVRIRIDADTRAVTLISEWATILHSTLYCEPGYMNFIHILSEKRAIIFYPGTGLYNGYLLAALLDIENEISFLSGNLFYRVDSNTFEQTFITHSYAEWWRASYNLGFISPNAVLIEFEDATSGYQRMGIIKISNDTIDNQIYSHRKINITDHVYDYPNIQPNYTNERWFWTWIRNDTEPGHMIVSLNEKLFSGAFGLVQDDVSQYDVATIVEEGYLGGLTGLKPGKIHYGSVWGDELTDLPSKNLSTELDEVKFWSATNLMVGTAISSTELDVFIKKFESNNRAMPYDNNSSYD